MGDQINSENNKNEFEQYITENINKFSFIGEKYEDSVDENGNPIKILCKYFKEKTYNETTKKSIKKYTENNREKINQYINNYKKNKCDTDENFKKKQLEYSRKYREKKKKEKNNK